MKIGLTGVKNIIIMNVVAEIQKKESQNRTVSGAYFSASRLISLQTRNSAAYKGIMALVYRESCWDFMKGTTMDIVKSMDESPDIHHIFPEAYCIKQRYPKNRWNSIIKKRRFYRNQTVRLEGKLRVSVARRL